jgi:alkaline phosphatase
MSYVDGFLLAVPKDKLNEYKKMAKWGAKKWMQYGALGYKECMLDDATPKDVVFPFGKAIKAKPDEAIFFSYIVYESKAHRNAVNKKVMSDPEMVDFSAKNTKMPYDPKRFAYGGFKVVVSS